MTVLAFIGASELLHRNYMLRLADAQFPKDDAELVPAAVPAPATRSAPGTKRELFDDVKSADVCTDPRCFRSKLDAEEGCPNQGVEEMNGASGDVASMVEAIEGQRTFMLEEYQRMGEAGFSCPPTSAW